MEERQSREAAQEDKKDLDWKKDKAGKQHNKMKKDLDWKKDKAGKRHNKMKKICSRKNETGKRYEKM